MQAFYRINVKILTKLYLIYRNLGINAFISQQYVPISREIPGTYNNLQAHKCLLIDNLRKIISFLEKIKLFSRILKKNKLFFIILDNF